MSTESPILLTDIVDKQLPTLAEQFARARGLTLSLAEPLSYEDCQIQATSESSSIKWHLAHTTWFFETFILKKYSKHYLRYAPRYDILFNSHYDSIGEQFDAAKRGLLSRPNLKEILRYREYVDEQMLELLNTASYSVIEHLIKLGIAHEHQHQEQMLMDLKYGFFQNPLYPAYLEHRELRDTSDSQQKPTVLDWQSFEGGLIEVGTSSDDFVFDHEKPAHKHYLEPYQLANRLVTNGEYLEFIEAGGYQKSEYWFADGWSMLKEQGVIAPLYWVKEQGNWHEFSLFGLGELPLHQPVSHISYYEACAFAVWQRKRLPTEQEWEHACSQNSGEAAYLDLEKLEPTACFDKGLRQMLGDVWEWTSSSYAPYPRFKTFGGDISEYNSKFMAGRQVLRGGSCITPAGLVSASYRKSSALDRRWHCSGIRLADDG